SARLKRAIGRKSPHPNLIAPAFFAAVALGSWLLSLPVGFFGGWLVERRFGLTKQTPRGWLLDELKGLALTLILQPLLLTGAWTVIKRRPKDWWLVLAALTAPLAAVFGYIAPLVIMPIFNTFTRLEDQALAARIQTLALQAGVNIADVFSIDMSRQSEKPNAFFAGLGSTKRIALGDTLLNRFEPDEIEGVVAHELGHQAHGDIWRMTGFAAASGFGLAWAMARLAPAAIHRTAGQSGVEDLTDEASFPVVAGVMTVLGFLLAPVQAAFLRRIERRTDAYAMELTRNGPAYARAMAKLASFSLADPDPPRPVVVMLYSHPPIAERIRAAIRFSTNDD
ncbi:MAG: M48 family metallopeptidase, partial [Thermomicrobiales bacterium]